MAKVKELHSGAFHFVYAVPNQQWWICYGSGGVSSWSILSKHNSHAEGLAAWHVLFPKKPK